METPVCASSYSQTHITQSYETMNAQTESSLDMGVVDESAP